METLQGLHQRSTANKVGLKRWIANLLLSGLYRRHRILTCSCPRPSSSTITWGSWAHQTLLNYHRSGIGRDRPHPALKVYSISFYVITRTTSSSSEDSCSWGWLGVDRALAVRAFTPLSRRRKDVRAPEAEPWPPKRTNRRPHDGEIEAFAYAIKRDNTICRSQ